MFHSHLRCCNPRSMFKRVKVKKGDTVKVISGGNRGKEGTVLSVDRKKDRVGHLKMIRYGIRDAAMN